MMGRVEYGLVFGFAWYIGVLRLGVHWMDGWDWNTDKD